MHHDDGYQRRKIKGKQVKIDDVNNKCINTISGRHKLHENINGVQL